MQFKIDSMTLRILSFLLFLLASLQISAQEDSRINPKKNWYFGAEIGSNTITSIKPDHENSFQGGILAEYYFGQHWSLSARLKYFKTGISYHNQPDYQFSGSVISMPINLNWEFGIAGNFNGNLKLVLSILRTFNKGNVNLDDLFQVGVIGLIKAIDNFDLSYGLKLSTYAVPIALD